MNVSKETIRQPKIRFQILRGLKSINFAKHVTSIQFIVRQSRMPSSSWWEGYEMAISKFFRNVWVELKRVTWPKRKELYSYTVTVVLTVLFLTIFFALIDLGVSALLKLITK